MSRRSRVRTYVSVRVIWCLSCGANIEHRGATAKRCLNCARSHALQSRIRRQKDLVLATWAVLRVQEAVKNAQLPHISTQICVDCGKRAEHYDHRDYYKPLEVEPVCRGCNKRRGPGYPYNQ